MPIRAHYEYSAIQCQIAQYDALHDNTMKHKLSTSTHHKPRHLWSTRTHAANLRTKIPDFRGFDSSILLMLRVGIPRPIGNFLGSLSQQTLAGIVLVGRSGVARSSLLQAQRGETLEYSHVRT